MNFPRDKQVKETAKAVMQAVLDLHIYRSKTWDPHWEKTSRP